MPKTKTKITIEDTLNDSRMYFKQIIGLTDLMIISANVHDIPNLITIKELAENGLNKLESISGKEN
ncbi:MAG: hypothetical protein ACI37S_06420 [Candidatus Gastranaerophilaceae bacterium]